LVRTIFNVLRSSKSFGETENGGLFLLFSGGSIVNSGRASFNPLAASETVSPASPSSSLSNMPASIGSSPQVGNEDTDDSTLLVSMDKSIGLFKKIFPFWQDFEVDTLTKLVKWLDQDKDNKLDMDDIFQCLNKVYKGDLLDQWQVCCAMILGEAATAPVNEIQLYNVFAAFIRIYRLLRNKQGIVFLGGGLGSCGGTGNQGDHHNHQISKMVHQLFSNAGVNQNEGILLHTVVNAKVLDETLTQFALDRGNVTQTFKFVLHSSWSL